MENQRDMDLEIAKLLKAEKKASENNNVEENLKKQDIEKISVFDELVLPKQEEVDSCVENGLLQIDDKEFKFKRTSFLDDKISFMFPYEILKLETDDPNTLTYINYAEGINCLISYHKGVPTMDIIKIKENVLLNFKKSRIKTNCPEEGAKRIGNEKVLYCIIENKIPDQNVFNLMFFVEVSEGYVIVNFNGFTERYYKLWIMIYKGIMNTIEIE